MLYYCHICRSSVTLVTESLHGLFSLGRRCLFLLLFSLNARNNIVNSEEEAGGLNGSLDDLVLDCDWLPNVDGCHIVDDLAISVDSLSGVVPLGVLSAKLSDDANHIHAAVGGQGLRNHLQSVSH